MDSRILNHLTADCAFDALALEVFGHQFAQNVSYRNYCEALGKRPSGVARWQDVPCLPTDAFKWAQVIAFPKEQACHLFTTSGTTTETRGRHWFPSLGIYERSILNGWDLLDLPVPERPVFLVPPPSEAEESSLSYMMGVLARETKRPPVWAVSAAHGLDVEAVVSAAEGDEPVALLGTALAFLHLFEQLESPLTFPAGSWAMETGGYKGTQRAVAKDKLYEMFGQSLGIAAADVINEYSMTELSSQFYTRGLGQAHYGPPWTRVRVMDPISGNDATLGEPGHLAIYDLANVHSAMAVQTQDLAIATDDGGFHLLGRDPTALPRGCSRASDDQLR